jgi:hypothetical protein
LHQNNAAGCIATDTAGRIFHEGYTTDIVGKKSGQLREYDAQPAPNEKGNRGHCREVTGMPPLLQSLGGFVQIMSLFTTF